MKEEKKLDDIRELKDEEIEAVSGGVIIFPYLHPACSYCGYWSASYLIKVGKKGNDDILRCSHCGVETVNGERI